MAPVGGHVALPPPHRYCTTTDATWTRRLKYLHGQIERYCAESLDYLWSNTGKIGRWGERAREEGKGCNCEDIPAHSAHSALEFVVENSCDPTIQLSSGYELRPASSVRHTDICLLQRGAPFPASNAIADVAELFGFETEHRYN
ncbi:hypothetical protein ALC57_18203 [Trachymyrmex cornetzi]|uniref:Uncharacterized protein n=1 Tax=Trachymyrmex cornetzi TaxID=471704 RepID=A0A195D9Z3_9HYME|nr:hypothetical protein ALC57_18203 [Trachymyrmex cornetzi]